LTFISIFQNILLLLIFSPIYYVWKYGNQIALNNLDLIATVLFLLFFTFETIADEQQWNFHLKKQKQQSFKTGSGFLREGLFRYSRHPNFFCEICLWWTFYLFSVAVSHQTSVWINYTIIGALFLTLLFQGSTAFTESISSKKYPDYKQYQKTTSKLIPWLPRKSHDQKNYQ